MLIFFSRAKAKPYLKQEFLLYMKEIITGKCDYNTGRNFHEKLVYDKLILL